MKPPFTRAERRKMRACAKIGAPILARYCVDHNPISGHKVAVTDDRAVEVLRRAFYRLLIEGGDIQVLALSDQTARAFPNCHTTQIPEQAKAWLAVGLDVDGRGTFALRHISTPFPYDPVSERRAVEALMRRELSPHLAHSGFQDQEARA